MSFLLSFFQESKKSFIEYDKLEEAYRFLLFHKEVKGGDNAIQELTYALEKNINNKTIKKSEKERHEKLLKKVKSLQQGELQQPCSFANRLGSTPPTTSPPTTSPPTASPIFQFLREVFFFITGKRVRRGMVVGQLVVLALTLPITIQTVSKLDLSFSEKITIISLMILKVLIIGAIIGMISGIIVGIIVLLVEKVCEKNNKEKVINNFEKSIEDLKELYINNDFNIEVSDNNFIIYNTAVHNLKKYLLCKDKITEDDWNKIKFLIDLFEYKFYLSKNDLNLKYLHDTLVKNESKLKSNKNPYFDGNRNKTFEEEYSCATSKKAIESRIKEIKQRLDAFCSKKDTVDDKNTTKLRDSSIEGAASINDKSIQ